MSRRPSTFALAITDAEAAVKRSDLSRGTPAESAELREALRALIQAVETLPQCVPITEATWPSPTEGPSTVIHPGVGPLPTDCSAETRLGELEAALRPFVLASEKWSERNRSGWRDEEAGVLDAAGNPVEWLAEIEVSNRDVLAAVEALASVGAPR